MERPPKDIHQVLGNLRRRVEELSKGDYSKGYRDELTPIREQIDGFPPNEIIYNLHKIKMELQQISEKIFSKVSDDANEVIDSTVDNMGQIIDTTTMGSITGGESRRDLMREEVNSYIVGLQSIIDRYKRYEPQRNTILYDKYDERTRREKIETLRQSLIEKGLIGNITTKDFAKVFSGKKYEIESPIDWKTSKYEFVHFIKELFKLNDIYGLKGKTNADWSIAESCFRYQGEPFIGNEMWRNNKTPSRYEMIDGILAKL